MSTAQKTENEDIKKEAGQEAAFQTGSKTGDTAECTAGECGTCGCADKTAAGKASDADSGNSADSAEQSAEKSAEERIAELEAEKNDFQDKYLRKSADLENYRKRMVKEKQEIFDYANANLLTDLIGVLDDFDRALDAGFDADGKPVADLKPVIDGVKMINKQLRSMLETKYDLTVYGEKGDLFDHDKHEAIATDKGAVAEAVCSEVYLKGYMLKDRVIRHAKVMVTMPDGLQDTARGAAEDSDEPSGN
ncbi:nucleotide exchange factor GrpE [Treponema sp. HNW]|uniref:nucleotide exchange factor GrpE n=1 Tax=Treponema sp. HNW TaxID=3116654 RepID=UPI003D100AB3